MANLDDITDMTTLRAEIDALDRDLIALFARRRQMIDCAARIKQTQDLPARIDWRVEEVVMNARRNADAAGLDPDLFETIWRRLVDAAIEQEDRQLKGSRP